MKKYVIAISIFCSFFVAMSAVASSKKVALQKEASKRAPVKEEAPFDVSKEKIALKDINIHASVFLAFLKNKSSFTKNEFETTTEFQSRVNKLCQSTLTGKLKYCDQVLFFMLNEPSIGYNADAGEVTATIHLEDVKDYNLREAFTTTVPPDKKRGQYFSSEVSPKAITVDSRSVDKKPYVGSNAFGAKIRVFPSIRDSYEVVVRGNDDLYKYGSAEIKFQAQPDVAKKIKESPLCQDSCRLSVRDLC